jgi:haloacetate dehalogenase
MDSRSLAGEKGALAEEAVAEYQRCFDAETIRATCEEFRAAATIDLAHDEADKGSRIPCPTLVLWRKSERTAAALIEFL